MKTSQWNHLTILVLWPLVAAWLSLTLSANYPVSALFFLGVPALLLTVWDWRHAPKAALFSLTFVPIWTAFNYIITTTGQWATVSAFRYRLPGNMSLEDIPWLILVMYIVVMFWEHFLDRPTPERTWNRRMSTLAGWLGLVSFIILILAIWVPGALRIPYFYAVMAIIGFAIPLALAVRAYPHLGGKLFRMSVYFLYTFTIYELTALSLGQWYYPSDKLIGWVDIRGLRFPVEELVVWLLIGAAACVAWYEHFDDDAR